jgi:hypothetical protein
MRLIPVAVLSAACFGQISHVTISEPTAVPTAILKPGQYTFSVADSLSDRKIVRVVAGEATVALFLMAPNPKLRRGRDSLVFWPENRQGRILRAWFIPGESIAAEAVYGKEEALELARRTGEPVPAIDPQSELRVAPDARLSRDDLAIVQLWSLDYGPVSAENRELAAAKLQTISWRPTAETLPRTASRHGTAFVVGVALLMAGLLLRRVACA